MKLQTMNGVLNRDVRVQNKKFAQEFSFEWQVSINKNMVRYITTYNFKFDKMSVF